MPRKSSNIKKSDQNKAWNKYSQTSKNFDNKKEIEKSFLIVCEGQTEEWYFNSFPVQTALVVAKGIGMTKYNLIEKARRMAKEADYDEVWCVFDLDRTPTINGQLDDFNKAVYADNGKKFRCAYSNDAFELWFYLHYNFTEEEQLRGFYYEQLSHYWSMSYERDGKAQSFSKTLYQRLKMDENASQENAINRAKQLFEIHKNATPHLQNPVTTVFELVEKLNEHLI
jgi:RloB-like protein